VFAWVLKLLVFGVFTFVLYQATVGMGERDLPTSRAWIVVAGLFGLLLLVVIDRLKELSISPSSLTATLAEHKMQALEDIREIDDREAADVARSEILQAASPEQVETAKRVAVELNASRIIDRATEAIEERRKCYVRYKPDHAAQVEAYQVAPLDIKPGKTMATRANDYLWVYSYDHESVLSLRLGRVQGIELSEETFDPAELMAGWKNQNPVWNVAREW
jgi:hypothetical protein